MVSIPFCHATPVINCFMSAVFLQGSITIYVSLLDVFFYLKVHVACTSGLKCLYYNVNYF